MLHTDGNVNAMPRKVSCKLVIGGNTITNVKMLTYNSDWSGDITIGQVVSSYITATIPTPSFALTGANVAHSMGIGSPNVEWVDIGQYTVDENSVRTRQGYTSFAAYDKLHDTVSTYHSSLTFPTTAQAVCDEICGIIGITSANLPIDFNIAEDILSGYTLRDVLGFIAALCGQNAYLNANNQLELRWFTASGYTADGTRANVPYIGENNCTVNRLICQSQDGTLISGSGEGIYFTCPLMTQDWLDWIQGNLAGFTYRKADVDIPYGNFCLQSGDIITVTTTGSNLTVPIMSNSWTYDGGLSSAVSAYGVSDYSGTANNAERSVSSRRVQTVINTKQTIKREQQQYTRVQQDIAHAAEVITGATGGFIKINFDSSTGETAAIYVMDQPSIEQALNVWVFNQGGIGHMQRSSTSVPFNPATDVNIAINMRGEILAEYIGGQKISGVALESTEATTNASQVLIAGGAVELNQLYNDIVTNIGRIRLRLSTGPNSANTVAVECEQGYNITIGKTGSPKLVYISDPQGGDTFRFYENVRFFDEVYMGTGSNEYTISSLKSTVDTIYNDIHGSGGILDRLDDLERRVSALE